MNTHSKKKTRIDVSSLTSLCGARYVHTLTGDVSCGTVTLNVQIGTFGAHFDISVRAVLEVARYQVLTLLARRSVLRRRPELTCCLAYTGHLAGTTVYSSIYDTFFTRFAALYVPRHMRWHGAHLSIRKTTAT